MFEFLSMAGTYEERKIDRFSGEDADGNELFISTCSVTDSEAGFETAIAHPEYNDNKIVVVEEYTTRNKAAAGHKRWLKLMLAKKRPARLVDESQCDVAGLVDCGDSDWREKPREAAK